MPISSTTKISAPNSASTSEPRKATTAPTMKLSSSTSGTASRPTDSMCETVEVMRQRRGFQPMRSAVSRASPPNATKATISRA